MLKIHRHNNDAQNSIETVVLKYFCIVQKQTFSF